MERTLASAIAAHVDALRRIETDGNPFNWSAEHRSSIVASHREMLRTLESFLPHGSGVDNGCTVDVDRSNAERIVVGFGYHHMNGNGYYDGWSDYTATVRPTFDGFRIKVQGNGSRRNDEDVRDYLADVLDSALSQMVTADHDARTYKLVQASRILTPQVGE